MPMKTLHHCRSCGHLSTSGGGFTMATASNGGLVKVCVCCAEDYGRDAEVTRWVDEAAASEKHNERVGAGIDSN